MKKSLITLLTLFAITSLMAQDVMLKKDDKVFSLGVGFGTNLYSGSQYSTQLPIFSASFELGFIDDLLDFQDLSLGLGGYVGFTTAKEEYKVPPVVYDHTYIIIGGRALVHYPFVENLDTYAGLMLGAKLLSSQSSADQKSSSIGINGFATSLLIGGRYYFTDRIAGMAEAGFGVSNITLGLAVKF